MTVDPLMVWKVIGVVGLANFSSIYQLVEESLVAQQRYGACVGAEDIKEKNFGVGDIYGRMSEGWCEVKGSLRGQ